MQVLSATDPPTHHPYQDSSKVSNACIACSAHDKGEKVWEAWFLEVKKVLKWRNFGTQGIEGTGISRFQTIFFFGGFV